MNTSWRRFGFVFFLLWALYLLWGAFNPPAPRGHVVEAPWHDDYFLEAETCWFPQPAERVVECARLHTPSAGGEFSLPVVVIRDPSPDRRADPLVYIPGGPGGASGLGPDAIDYWIDWLMYAELERDLVLMDPRGTGRSLPRLECEEFERFSVRVLEENKSLVDEMGEGLPVVRECFTRLAQDGFDVAHYGTRVSARDLAGLMAALPEYTEWNLLGVSYGSRLGLIIPEYAENLRSVILDSVYPPDLQSFQQWPEVLGGALETFFEWCSRHGCHGERDLEEDFYQALEVLRSQTLGINVPRWDGAPAMWVVMNDHRLLSAIFSSLYSVYAWDSISPAITAVLERDRRALTPLVENWINISFSEDFSSLVFMVVDCQDELVGTEEAFMASVARWPLLAPYTQDLLAYDGCGWLIPEPVHLVEDWELPTVPALLLAGAQDPITPSHWAEALHARWPGSQLLIRDGVGHGVADSDPCVLAALRDFLDQPDETWQPNCN